MVTDDPSATAASESAKTSGPAVGEAADAMLARFVLTSPVAHKAASLLREGAEVAVAYTDMAGEWRFYVNAGNPAIESGKAQDPDFELRLTAGAVRSICLMPDADLGDFGVAFFEHIVSRNPDHKIRVRPYSGVIKLTRRGWLSLLARGGPKLAIWMARKGLRGSGDVVAALARLKGSP
jgi:hypothetical protein